MKNNKGFTLIELIATIALLAIIAVISFVSVNSVIKKNKIDNCRTIVNSITTAANEYVSDNRYNSTFVDSINAEYQTVINASTLISNKYLKGDIIDPYTKEVIDPETISVGVYLGYDYAMRAAVINAPEVLKNCDVTPLDSIPELPAPDPYDPDGDNDKTPPIVLYSLNGGSFMEMQTVTITATDVGSGIDFIAVKVYKDNQLIATKSNNKIKEESFTVNLDDYGTWRIKAYAYDNAGNKSNQSPKDSEGWYYQDYVIQHKPLWIYFNPNNGNISGQCITANDTKGTCTLKGEWAAVGNTYANQICKYGQTCNLRDYNGEMKFTRVGFTPTSGKEWKARKSNNAYVEFNQASNLTYDQLQAAAWAEDTNRFRIWLYVNWQANELTFADQTITKTFSTSGQTASITAASNGTGTYTYSEVSEKNASGTKTSYISISGTTINIAANTPVGTYTYVVRATDSNSGSVKDATYTITIGALKCSAPTNVAISAAGVVTWTASSNCSSAQHQVKVASGSYANASSGVNKNSDIVAATGSRTVYVKAVAPNNNYSDSDAGTASKTVYSVTLSKGTGIDSVSGGGKYISGATVTLGATPSTGYTWSKWTQTSGGTQVSTTKAYSGTITSNWAYTANATLNTITVKWDKNFFSNNLLGNDPISSNVTLHKNYDCGGGDGGYAPQYYPGAYNTKSYYINANVVYGSTTNTDAGFYIKNMPTLTNGTEYTVSYFIRTQGHPSDTYNKSGPAQGGTKSITVTDNWQRIQYTFKASSPTNANKVFQLYRTSNKTDDCQYLGIQIHSLELMQGKPSLTSTQQTLGGKLVLPTEPTRSGFIFSGWFTQPVGGTQVTADTNVPTSETTYYAQWAYKVDTSATCVKRLSIGGKEAMCYGTRQQVTSEGRCQWGCMNATCHYTDGSGSQYYGNIEGGSC